jgi:hypothetical protein
MRRRECTDSRIVEYAKQEQTSIHFQVDTDSSNQGIDYIEISQPDLNFASSNHNVQVEYVF